ncbi:methyltransferase domain-containing protein [Saprospira sp. CCB-QB6]|uniref:class I SAM-dependent methyltransferase n=1 Tax=Saprospira sp. CCB-QB6 TaxID=3023936 RepID=UPI00234A4656|nr:methyltransferase domain-containing protein [Saprospira sp. CCB-QB6]WCL81446.1 methyltransferase domain-containing protein [Saprospira sp. CCB-QB6]
MKKLSLALLLFIGACSPSEIEQTDMQTNPQENKNLRGDIQLEMHKASIEELVQIYESKERDEYQQPSKVLAYMGELSGKKIMDIGAGSGYFSVKFAAAGAQVIAADVDTGFQNYLHKRIVQDKIENIELRLLPYNSPKISAQEVDWVFISNTYQHIEDRVAYFKAVKRGLKEGGQLLIIDFFKKELPIGPAMDHKIKKEQVLEELKAAGFVNFELKEELLPYQYVIKAK